MYRRWPSAYSVSKARLDFPDPETPVSTTSFFLGISTVTFLRLCWRAPAMMMRSSSMRHDSCGQPPGRNLHSIGRARRERARVRLGRDGQHPTRSTLLGSVLLALFSAAGPAGAQTTTTLAHERRLCDQGDSA